MRRVLAVILFFVVSAVLLFTLSCGGTSMSMQGRQLQSITVTPMSADAKNSSNGMVQFSAMGNFNMAPMNAMTPVTWTIGPFMSSMPVPAGVSINAMTGVAQCSGFTGTVIVMATAPIEPEIPLNQMSTMTMNVSGSAQLTCP
jgi:hypothetical protein